MKAQTCKLSNLKDSLIRDHIVCGIICNRTCARLLKDSELTLQKALDICRANEATTSQLKTLSSCATNSQLIKNSSLFKNDIQPSHEEPNVTNVVLNTNATRISQPMAWSATTVGGRIIFQSLQKSTPLQSNTAKSTVLHMMDLTLPTTSL